ncbi:hypothetical protein IOC61_15625 [Halomonas sp. KAO]|nr:hypothetical protein [Halomonas sp. KAO]MBF7054733.1 hypothetical protein [Halomonas sp. KAO]
MVYLLGCPLQCGYCETASGMEPARRAAAEALESLAHRLRRHFGWVELRG